MAQGAKARKAEHDKSVTGLILDAWGLGLARAAVFRTTCSFLLALGRRFCHRTIAGIGGLHEERNVLVLVDVVGADGDGGSFSLSSSPPIVIEALPSFCSLTSLTGRLFTTTGLPSPNETHCR